MCRVRSALLDDFRFFTLYVPLVFAIGAGLHWSSACTVPMQSRTSTGSSMITTATARATISTAAPGSMSAGNNPTRTLDDIIHESWSNLKDDRITLKFPQVDQNAKILNLYSDIQVLQPRIGENVILTCVASTENTHGVSWTHLGRTIFDKGRRITDDGVDNQLYNVTTWGHVGIFGILRVSLQSEGEVVCWEELTSFGYKRAVTLKRFSIEPQLTRAVEVFAEFMPKQSVVQGDVVCFSCAVRLPLPQRTINNLPNSIMWRLNGETRWAPKEEPYWSHFTARTKSWRLGGESYRFPNITNVFGQKIVYQMDFHYLTTASSGNVECWFRIHGTTHDWVMQSTELIINARTPRS
ncbi:uncharacterized protein LOC129587150 [Paramacrobiotus metropolitanus]|uniref:uncharacterized protein LOC129587150 n=1 Tax=Paramacrobiotus metropolitanus TaxID=2943436 RepID=UPI00244659E8|nr:uncharacterized protein LOC129587150 [Paramacrobiotus metropolitanus]